MTRPAGGRAEMAPGAGRPAEPGVLERTPLPELMEQAAALRDRGRGGIVTYSRKVFIPLTHLCRDVCHYCTFARRPHAGEPAYMTPDQAVEVAHAGRARGCKEALFTLGDRPEARYAAARRALRALGYGSTVEYLRGVAERVLAETGLLPHVNCGVLDARELALLRPVSPSMGLMLESASRRLLARGGPHFGSPDKDPDARLACIRAAGELRIPLTTGILVGIGETREERLQSLLRIAELHARYGHVQEVIVQNFVPKAGTRMERTPEPPLEELLWSVAAARLVFGPEMPVQVPPNLNAGRLELLLAAGADDWGGVSPLTPDHVNPERPWPALDALEARTAAAGMTLVERLTLHPPYVRAGGRWLDPSLTAAVLRLSDGDGFAREDGWTAGRPGAVPSFPGRRGGPESPLAPLLARAARGETLAPGEVAVLFRARGPDAHAICRAADALRREVSGDEVTCVVNRNINYTNACTYRCSFCAFSKGRPGAAREAAYLVPLHEVSRRAAEAWARGATEVCMQGGIHPDFTGRTYLDLCRAAREGAPGIHVHAFSPLEVVHGAATLRIPVREFLQALKEAGLGSLPGTAAEILDDRLRAVLCPDKIRTEEWLRVVETAHEVGLPTTSTIMFGHLDDADAWSSHLLALRALQARTGGITEFVPLPFVHMEAPLYRRGRARPGPTFREAVLMHAVARLVLHPLVPNVQASWTKLGPEGALRCLQSGANDLGGTLMNESISRAAGACHGQELPAERMKALAASIGRPLRVRSTLYGPPPSCVPRPGAAAPLLPVVALPARRRSTGAGGEGHGA